MLNVIKTSGCPFSHGISSCEGFRPSKFEWHHGDNESVTSDVTVYFDYDHMGGFRDYRDFRDNSTKLKTLIGGFSNTREKLKFLTGNFRKYGTLNNHKDRLKFLWLSESKAVTGKVHEHVLKKR